eukprot:1379687-Amorphochlora_amoeboformis.AAC.2
MNISVSTASELEGLGIYRTEKAVRGLRSSSVAGAYIVDGVQGLARKISGFESLVGFLTAFYVGSVISGDPFDVMVVNLDEKGFLTCAT